LAFARELTVSAASSLSNAFTEISDLFTRDTGITVHLNFASSTNLLRQIEQGAPVDIFASADQETMDKAAAGKHIIPTLRCDFALNSLVLITPSHRLDIISLSSLTLPSVERIAIGKPETVPAGRYTRSALLSSQLWETLLPVFVFGNNVRQVLGYVQRGEADAGFVYKTDALSAQGKVRIAMNITGHEPIRYPIAVTEHCGDRDAAMKFLDYVLSQQGTAVLEKFGFLPCSRPRSDCP
jgi:molybdate transport system substrate-binding protein